MTTIDINARAHTRERDADSFNYADFPDGLAQKMQDAASDIRRYTRDAYVDVGKKLLEIKGGLEHGQFTMWVENACYLKIRTAERAMQVAELVEKNVNLTYLPQQALLLLASRSAPKRLRDAIIRRIDAGERPAAAEIGRQLYRGRASKGPQPHLPDEEQQVEPADRDEEAEGLPEILAVDVRDLDAVERVALRLITALGNDIAELVPDLERITTAALVQEVRHLRPDLFANRDQEDGAHRSQKVADSAAQPSSITFTPPVDISCHHPQGTCRYAGCQASGRCLATRSSAVAA